MEFWDEIVNTAMLGAGKKMPSGVLLPAAIQPLAEHILKQPLEQEEQLLQLTSLAFNYRQAGITALQNKGLTITKAPEEEKLYCSNAAMQALNEVLDIESYSLLQLWLQLCNGAHQLVLPTVIPALLQLAVQHKKLRTAILEVCGKRGLWLCRFNKDWNFTGVDNAEAIWQTGTLEQRKQVLRDIRLTNTAKAIEWLQQTWKQEDANTRLELLPAIEINISDIDIPFLVSLSGDGSKKVKALSLALLKKIPSSPIVQQYCQIVKQAIFPKKEKAMFGLTSKTVLQVQQAVVDESTFATGIEKLSSDKNMPDDLFILYQLMQYVNPGLYEEWWQFKPQDIIDLLQKDETGKRLLPAVVLACIRFNNKAWALHLMQHSNKFYLDVLPLLPITQQEFYSNKFFTGHEDSIIRYALVRESEWGFELAVNILRYAAKNTYQYNRAFFSQHIQLIPVSVTAELDNISPSEEYSRNTWVNTTAHVTKLLQLKTKTIQSFNS